MILLCGSSTLSKFCWTEWLKWHQMSHFAGFFSTVYACGKKYFWATVHHVTMTRFGNYENWLQSPALFPGGLFDIKHDDINDLFVLFMFSFCFFESDKGIFWVDLPKKKWLVCWLLSHVFAISMVGLSRHSLQLLMYKTWCPFGKISHASIKNHSVPDLRHFLKLPCVFPQQYYNRNDFWKTAWSKLDVV